MYIDTAETEHCTDAAKRSPTNKPRPLFSPALTLPPPVYSGADKSLARADWGKKIVKSSYLFRRGGHCCRGDQVERTIY